MMPRVPPTSQMLGVPPPNRPRPPRAFTLPSPSREFDVELLQFPILNLADIIESARRSPNGSTLTSRNPRTSLTVAHALEGNGFDEGASEVRVGVGQALECRRREREREWFGHAAVVVLPLQLDSREATTTLALGVGPKCQGCLACRIRPRHPDSQQGISPFGTERSRPIRGISCRISTPDSWAQVPHHGHGSEYRSEPNDLGRSQGFLAGFSQPGPASSA